MAMRRSSPLSLMAFTPLALRCIERMSFSSIIKDIPFLVARKSLSSPLVKTQEISLSSLSKLMAKMPLARGWLKALI